MRNFSNLNFKFLQGSVFTLGLVFFASSIFLNTAFSAAPVTVLNTDLNNQNNSASNPANNSNSGLTTAQQLHMQSNQIQYIQSELVVLNSMQNAISDLRDQNEQLAHRVSELEAHVQSLQSLMAANNSNSNLNTTPKALPVAQPSTAASPESKPESKPELKQDLKKSSPKKLDGLDLKSEEAAYQQAYSLIASNRYDDAIASFNKLLTQYPAGKRAADANYWLGDLYMLKGQPDQATQEFRKVLNFKNSSKIPDSLRQLGILYQANGDSAHAKQMFQRVIKDYPGTPAATAAQKQIDNMN